MFTFEFSQSNRGIFLKKNTIVVEYRYSEYYNLYSFRILFKSILLKSDLLIIYYYYYRVRNARSLKSRRDSVGLPKNHRRQLCDRFFTRTVKIPPRFFLHNFI